MNEGLRVCIAAENASLRMGGEAILPYHYFRLLLARGMDVHLITHERSREELLSLFPQHGGRLHFVRDRFVQKVCFRLGKLLPRRVAEATFGLLTQLLTQRSQCRLLRTLGTRHCVIHQPIPVSPRFPSLLSGLGAPLIVGPLNGGMEFPPAFREAESAASRLLVRIGRSLTDVVNAVFPGKRKASVLLVANRRTRVALPRSVQGRILEMPENGVDVSQWLSPAPSAVPVEVVTQRGPAQFLFIGRLVDWKALDLVLEAMATLESVELDVAGDGPMRSAWEGKARELKIAGRVRFHGWQTQAEAAALLQKATALVLPSLYESGGAVVLEAMAAARPVIATAWGGPTDYLDASCGLLIEPTSRPALEAGFAEAMMRLANSPELCVELGMAGRARALEGYDWESKIDQMLLIYESALQTHGETC